MYTKDVVTAGNEGVDEAREKLKGHELGISNKRRMKNTDSEVYDGDLFTNNCKQNDAEELSS